LISEHGVVAQSTKFVRLLQLGCTGGGTAQHSTAQHSTAQHSTAQHSTAQHSTAQHNILQTSAEGRDHDHKVGAVLCIRTAVCRGTTADTYVKLAHMNTKLLFWRARDGGTGAVGELLEENVWGER
jgi:hypothetical protein